MNSLRMAYVTRVVDEKATALATQVRWIRTLASRSRVESLTVLAARVGQATLPNNVEIREFGRGKGGLLRFLAEAAKVRKSIDAYYVSQGGPFPALLLPLKLGGGPSVYQWKAHSVVSPRMKFYAKYCDDLVFTSAPSSFPFEVPGRRVVGQGIDCDQFQPSPDVEPDRDMVCIGRVSPIKGLEEAISIVSAIREQHDTVRHLDIVGPGREEYVKSLRALAERLGVQDQVHFVGAVTHDEVVRLLPRYRASLNLSGTALDKTVLESMACGVPIVTSNLPTIESVPGVLLEDLRVDGLPTERAAAKVEAVLRLDGAERADLGARLRSVVVEDHSIERLFEKILDEIQLFEEAKKSPR